MDLLSLARPELILAPFRAQGSDDALLKLATLISERAEISSPEALYQRLLEREELGSTVLCPGFAVPHCRCSGLAGPLLAVAICDPPVQYGQAKGDGTATDVQVFFVVVAPIDGASQHLQALAAISRLLTNDTRRTDLLAARDDAEVLRVLAEPEE